MLDLQPGVHLEEVEALARRVGARIRRLGPFVALMLPMVLGVIAVVALRGSTTTGRKIVSTTTGGNLSIAVADSATGGHATTAVKLATTTGGIAGATPGAALTIGAYLNGGTSGAFAFVAQYVDAVGSGVYDATISLYVAPGAKEQAVT
jgi:hypothetical protein